MTIIGKVLAAGALLAGLLVAAPSSAQNTTCPTAPFGTSNNQCASTAFVQGAVSVGGIVIGATPITSGTAGRIIYDNSGIVGELPVTGSAGNVVLSIAPTITGHPTIEGVTSTGASGTGNFIFGTSPSISGLTVTGSLTATGLVSNADLANPATTVNGQICTLGSTCTVTAAATGITVGTTTVSGGTPGRVEFNNGGVLGEYPVTGTAGSVVLSSSPTIAGLTVTGSFTATGLVTNGDLVSPTTTVNGTACTLGSTCTITAVAGTITVGTTTVASGTTTRILYDNAGVLGEYTLTGTGTVTVMQTSPSLVTPALGVATATSLAVNAATLGSNAVAAIGQFASFGATTTAPGFYTYLNGDTVARVAIGLDSADIPRLSFGPGGATTRDTFLTRMGAAVLQIGAPNVNGAPVAQTLQAQSPLAGSATNTAGANWTIIGSLGTGTGTGGDIVFQTNVKTTTGTAQGTATTVMTVKAETLAVDFAGPTNTTGTATWAGTLIAPIRTVTASGAVTVSAATDYYICVDKGTGAATTVNLPASPTTGLTYVIKDCKGDAATNNITITPNSGNIDNTSTYVISTNLASVAVIYNGTGWFVF